MNDRDKWLEALQDFGCGPDVDGGYAKHIEGTRIFREFDLVTSEGQRRTLLLSNDNNSNYSADIFNFTRAEQNSGLER
jgi:hypothetical protein